VQTDITSERIEAKVVEIIDQLEALGDDVIETSKSESETEDGRDQFYVIAESDRSQYYFAFQTGYAFATIVYPLHPPDHIAGYCDESEVEALLNEAGNDETEFEDEAARDRAAGKQIIDQTPERIAGPLRHELSAYGSTSLVKYRAYPEDTHKFPYNVQCTRNVFPFDERNSLREINDRIDSVMIAGSRARRFLNAQILVDKEDKSPNEYQLTRLA